MPVAEKESKKISKVGGARKGAGRPKGTPNKDKAELLDLITSTGCKHPLQGLAEIAKQSHDEGNFDLAVTCYKELAPYVAAKRKAVEHTTDSDTNQPIQINIVSAAP